MQGILYTPPFHLVNKILYNSLSYKLHPHYYARWETRDMNYKLVSASHLAVSVKIIVLNLNNHCIKVLSEEITYTVHVIGRLNDKTSIVQLMEAGLSNSASNLNHNQFIFRLSSSLSSRSLCRRGTNRLMEMFVQVSWYPYGISHGMVMMMSDDDVSIIYDRQW